MVIAESSSGTTVMADAADTSAQRAMQKRHSSWPHVVRTGRCSSRWQMGQRSSAATSAPSAAAVTGGGGEEPVGSGWRFRAARVLRCMVCWVGSAGVGCVLSARVEEEPDPVANGRPGG